MFPEFSGWNVIVTGGVRGIGLAISKAFLSAGARVTAIYRSSDDAAKKLLSEYPAGNLQIVKFDVSSISEAENFFKKYNEEHESLEVVVNNAGIRRDNAVGMMPLEDWNSVISSNLTGTFIMSKLALLKMMEKRFGRIINITSPSGKYGFQGQANYAASKAGQVAFTKSLAKEAAKRKITVNCVSPGFIETDFISDIDEDMKKRYLETIPMKRFGKPEEVADAVLFLSSLRASYITGTVLEVAGGL